jgi:RNA-binding protein YlmH
MDKKHNIQMHFHPDERAFVDRVMDWTEQVAENHSLKQTDFLDPRQAFIVESIVRRNPECQVHFDGGYGLAERKRAIIARDYIDFKDEPASVMLLSITSDDTKFASLVHGDFLGALLGVGIKRDKIGDIHLHSEEGFCHVVVAAEISDYIHLQLQQVHRAHVITELLPIQTLKPTEKHYEEMNLSVASMRLDGIVSDIVRVSRAKIIAPIKAGRCKVNWRVTEDPSTLLKEGDVISLQGFGRFELLEVLGESKSGRMRLRIGKIR